MLYHADIIHELSTKTYPLFQNTPFDFSLTNRAAKHNIHILAQHNNNLEDTLAAVSSHTHNSNSEVNSAL